MRLSRGAENSTSFCDRRQKRVYSGERVEMGSGRVFDRKNVCVEPLLECAQVHVHRVSDAIQPSHPLLSPSPPAPNPSQHQSLFQ